MMYPVFKYMLSLKQMQHDPSIATYSHIIVQLENNMDTVQIFVMFCSTYLEKSKTVQYLNINRDIPKMFFSICRLVSETFI